MIIYNINNIKHSTIKNTSKVITIRQDTTAIRNNKFDFASHTFDNNFPTINTYNLCEQNLCVVFKSNSRFMSKIYGQNTEYPLANNNIPVKDILSEINCTGGEGSPLCYANESTVVSIGSNYDTTIYGYAFYTETFRDLNIPNIGNVPALCAGGHVCCRTEFTPTLIMDSNIIPATNSINLNNYGSCIQSTLNVPGFTDLSGYDRSSTFEFVGINPSLLSTSKFFLSCDLPGCHNGVTMIVLVARNLDTDSYEIIFNECVPACLEVEIGKVKVPEGTPVPCITDDEEECDPPPPNCDYLSKTQAIISFDGLDIGLEATGSEELRQSINDIMAIPVLLEFTTVNTAGIAADPVLIGSIGSIQVLVFWSAVHNGLGTLNMQIAVNVLQTASAYPYIYGANFTFELATDDICNFNQDGGQAIIGNGVTGPFFTNPESADVYVTVF